MEVLQQQGKWTRIKLCNDHYEGWISSNQILPISEDDFRLYQNTDTPISSGLIDLIEDSEGRAFPVVIGSELPGLEKGSVKFGKATFTFGGECIMPAGIPDRNAIIETAFLFLNAPYLWGGKSPLGIDCSGFTQMVFKLNGIRLPRDARDQVSHGKTLAFLEESRPGDLAFFDNEEGRIIHVGILLRDMRILHASGKVKINKIDHQGILSDDGRSYTHHLRIMRNLLAD